MTLPLYFSELILYHEFQLLNLGSSAQCLLVAFAYVQSVAQSPFCGSFNDQMT
jgi:hypothetical protein